MIAKATLAIWLGLGMLSSGFSSLVSQTSLGGDLYLVNRSYRLTEHYQPPDMVLPDVRRQSSAVSLRPNAAQALEEMFAAAQEAGHRLVAVSGYRSFETQRLLYQRKINATGSQAKAQLLVAPPGTSEHQLGLAIDIGRLSSSNLNAAFGKSKEGQWVRDNAHLFGFIFRYQGRWTDITGYADEPWHLRYIGVSHASAIHQLDIPLETYIQQLATLHYGEYLADASTQTQ